MATAHQAAEETAPKKQAKGWRDVMRALRRPKVLVMLLLGFSSGLPFLLTGNTLGFWLREGGSDLAAIGFLSWIGIVYSLKMLWAPLVDRLDVPGLGWLGRRRGWMLVSQIIIGAGLLGMAAVGPAGGEGLWALGGFALMAAFASATQDIVVDAWRIESAADGEEQGLLSAAYQIGYRAAMLATDSLILLLAAGIGWQMSYGVAGLTMVIGIGATLAATEPVRAALTGSAVKPLWSASGLFDAYVGPLLVFLRSHGQLALLMLLVVCLYRLGDFMIGPMINPFYVDLGLTKEVVGTVRASVGLWASVAGIALGGLCSVKLGFGKTLILGAILGPFSNLAFSAMALAGPDIGVFTAAIIVDNISTGFAGVALTAYMSSLTSIGYTATQYALLTSFYALLGKVLKGFSGGIVDALTPAWGLLHAYGLFFAGTALVGVPVVILCIILNRATAAHRQP
ncbi:AmpG family muropeptide MFS transporter [Niveispirillum irakense]|uniref:AmpG family muropeptide MFS transporter n=1 Tax=Niveispirillum irakense TaxID=34011 RepID=UPI0003F87CCB|nr:MFS transporter [Niveispirillum irakense]